MAKPTPKNSKKEDSKHEIILYTDKRGNVELRADVEKETILATLDQIAQIFGVTPPKVNDLVHQKSTGARAGDFLVVLLIAIVVIGGIILAAYLLYGRS